MYATTSFGRLELGCRIQFATSAQRMASDNPLCNLPQYLTVEGKGRGQYFYKGLSGYVWEVISRFFIVTYP